MTFKCERCCKCCSDPTIIVTVNHRDILRLEFFLPDIDLFKFLAFYQTQENDPSLEKKLMSPAIITNRGKTFLGLQRKGDNCIFLHADTCQIYDCRPHICRCFPYTFQVRKDLIYWSYSSKAKEICPTIKPDSTPNNTELEELAHIMIKETDEFKQLINIWNNLAQNNLIDPTPQLLLLFLTGKIKLTIENIKKITD